MRSIALSTTATEQDGTKAMPIDQAPQDPYIAGFQKSPEQARHEARAKVFWGDPPEDVVKFLQMQGFQYDDACIVVDQMYTERERVIRACGLRKLMVGFGLMGIPAGTLLIFLHLGVMQWHLMAITVVIGLGGAYFCLKGTFMLVSPRTETGEVDDQ